METTVLFFGELAEIAGNNKIVLQNIENTFLLNEVLLLHYPALKNKRYIIAVNKEVINEKKELKEGDEIALLPPFGGG